MTLLAIDPSSKVKAIARHAPGLMNRTETAYAAHLDLLIKAGEVSAYLFEGVRLIIGNSQCAFTPDFMVVLSAGYIEFHEVKGFWREAARVRIKVAAKQFPWFTFIAVTRRTKKQGRGWNVEKF